MVAGGMELRAARVSFVNGLSTIVTLIFQLASVPICLKYWGKDFYGSWLALLSAYMMLRSLDAGFAAYVGNELNVLYHRGTEELRRHLASAVIGTAIISVLQVGVAGATMLFYPLAAVLGMPDDHRDSLSASLGLMALMVSWALTGSYIGIVFRLQVPAGMLYQAGWWGMATQMVQFSTIMVAAVIRLNLLTTSMLFSITQAAIAIASALCIRKALPQFYPWLRGAEVRLGLDDLRRSLLLTGSNLVQQSTTNGAVLMVSMFAGPGAVPLFTTVRTVTNLWTAVTTVLTAPLLPEVVRLHVRGEIQKLFALNEVFWAVISSAVNLGALALYPVIPFLYGRWTAHSVTLDNSLLCLMLASVVVTNTAALMALHLNGINSLRILMGSSVARATISLGCGALLFRRMGIASFGLGILGGELAAALMITRHSIKYELVKKGLRLSPTAFTPVVLSTGSALVFFVGAAYGWWSNQSAWVLAMAIVAAASIWGWKALDLALRSRLTRLATHWFA